MKKISDLEKKALGLLARREYSRGELTSKLMGGDESLLGEIDQLMDFLEGRGYVSDERAAESILRAYQEKCGVNKIRQVMQAKKINENVVADVLKKLRSNEYELLRALFNKRYPVPPSTLEERARCMRYFQNRGYTWESVQQVLKDCIKIYSV
jgi:regulatory protein